MPTDIAELINGASILITGATGSFGRQLVKALYQDYQPRRIIVFSRDELKQHEMRQVFPDSGDSPMRYFLGDVREIDTVRQAFEGVDIVVSAAALKQVPALEYAPFEAIRTNILGAKNIITAALQCNVKKVIGLSSDKATAPTSLYGATKLVMEKLFIQANSYRGLNHPTRFSCVRYGNVLGSRGSVVPLWREQMKTGAITITSPEMTRYWITLPQAVRFVMTSLAMMRGGEVFVPKLGSIRMDDLADIIAPDAKKVLIGVRPGEKMHESMVSVDEGWRTVDIGDRYCIQPAHPWWKQESYPNAAPMSEGWYYSSNANNRWLTAEDVRQMLEDV